jgi:hypothetical protein
VGVVHCLADDIDRRDLQLVVDPSSPLVADAGHCRDWFVWRGTGDGDLAHFAGNQRDLRRAVAVQYCVVPKV